MTAIENLFGSTNCMISGNSQKDILYKFFNLNVGVRVHKELRPYMTKTGSPYPKWFKVVVIDHGRYYGVDFLFTGGGDMYGCNLVPVVKNT